MIDLDEIFLNILKICLIELKLILLYCISRITAGHRITPGHFIRWSNLKKKFKKFNFSFLKVSKLKLKYANKKKRLLIYLTIC